MNAIIRNKRHKVRHRVPLRMRLRSGWPLLVWVLAGLICIPLIVRKGNWQMAERIHGVVGKETIVISPEATARVQKILVKAGQMVTNGQPLVEMDTVSIEHELAETLLDAHRTAYSINQQLRNLRDDVADRGERVAELEKDLTECRMELQAEEAELALLLGIQGQRDGLGENNILDARTLYEYQPRIAELEQKTTMREKLAILYEQQLIEAKKRMVVSQEALDAFEAKGHDADYVRTMLGRIEEETRRYRDSYTLRSPSDGLISEVRSEEGEVVRADNTVLRVVPSSLSTVVALVPEQFSILIKKGQRVWVSALNTQEKDGRVDLPAITESLSEEIRVEAAMLNIAGRVIPMRSRRAILRIEHPEESALIAGEVVEIRLTEPRKSGLQRLINRLTGRDD
ncbi:MAG: HlyD family efflux transporter periplasmic adaptor subunit [Spartobacteria bacterium]|nr:HlyD family efflux transporter periplasmic adaptor subunit [Spartobacteria bacterium]